MLIIANNKPCLVLRCFYKQTSLYNTIFEVIYNNTKLYISKSKFDKPRVQHDYFKIYSNKKRLYELEYSLKDIKFKDNIIKLKL